MRDRCGVVSRMGAMQIAAVGCLLLALTGCGVVSGLTEEQTKFFSNERKLYHKLVDPENLDKNVRPVAHSSHALKLGLGLNLVKIQDLDERAQKLSANIWLKLTWTDIQLTWDPNDYDNITQMMIPASKIWNPDIVLYNMAYTNEANLNIPEILAVVDNKGTVLYIPHLHVESTCKLDMSNFPYDSHNCSLTFGSWVFSNQMMELDFFYGMKMLDVADYNDHSEWELVGHDAVLNSKKYDCCEEIYQDVTFSVLLKRRNAYYTQVFVAPSVILLFLTPTIFWLPPDCNEKMTLGTGIMLGHVLMLVMLENYIPAAHSVVPVIGRYFMFGLIMVGLSLVLSVMVRNIWSQSNRKRAVPAFLRTVVLRLLGRLLCVSADTWRPHADSTATFRQLEDLDSGSTDMDTSKIIFPGQSPADEWRRVAVVLDRLFFLLFVILMVVASLSLLHY